MVDDSKKKEKTLPNHSDFNWRNSILMANQDGKTISYRKIVSYEVFQSFQYANLFTTSQVPQYKHRRIGGFFWVYE